MTLAISRATVEAFYRAYAAQDTPGLSELLDDDVVWTITGPVEVLNWCGTWRGKAAVIDLIDRVIPGQFRVVRFSQQSLLIDGASAATLNRLSARRCCDGRIISYRLAHFMQFRGGRMLSNVSLIDSFDAAEQMLGHSLASHDDGHVTGLVAV